MEGRGGCCIVRYGAGVCDMSEVDRIMLRFRPIAPKPTQAGSGSIQENGESYSKCGRGKRRGCKGERRKNNSSDKSNNGSKRCGRKKKASGEEKRDSLSTLPLIPETPDQIGSPMGVEPKQTKKSTTQMWLSFDQAVHPNHVGFWGSADRMVLASPQAVGSWVTVECVTETWMNGEGLGRTDQERKATLEKDTCPAFLSDEMGRVTWTNGAYQKMMGGEMAVWLLMKERPMLTYPAFTCRVRVQYISGKEKSSLTLPCDVWRMDYGGFAWRLDTNAALCLGR